MELDYGHKNVTRRKKIRLKQPPPFNFTLPHCKESGSVNMNLHQDDYALINNYALSEIYY